MTVKNLAGIKTNLNGVNYEVYSEVVNNEVHLELHSEENGILNFVVEDNKCLELNTRAEWHELSNWYNAQ